MQCIACCCTRVTETQAVVVCSHLSTGDKLKWQCPLNPEFTRPRAGRRTRRDISLSWAPSLMTVIQLLSRRAMLWKRFAGPRTADERSQSNKQTSSCDGLSRPKGTPRGINGGSKGVSQCYSPEAVQAHTLSELCAPLAPPPAPRSPLGRDGGELLMAGLGESMRVLLSLRPFAPPYSLGALTQT
jgi:hypothetical protein